MLQKIRISPQDNVAVVLEDNLCGVPRGHKIALCDIKKGEAIIKYGQPIGHATTDIKKDEHVHTHNVKTDLSGVLEYIYTPEKSPVEPVESKETFSAFVRKDGRVGIRNHIFIVPTVGCVNALARNLAAKINASLPCGSVDRAIALEHPYGCSQLGADHALTRTMLGDLVKHPNSGGTLVVGLGCENNTIGEFKSSLGDYDSERIKFLVAQDVGDELAEGEKLLRELVATAKNDVKTAVPISKLVVGLKCGGSDGLSGVTANPMLGRFSDYLLSRGGTAILSEVPEMFGAEKLLFNRCRSKELFEKCVKMINDFKNYFLSHGEPVGENPSPGNKAGGITSLEDKSLGCTQKSGLSPVSGCLNCGETVVERGLNLLSGPGNDLVASTLLAAAGAHLILFTTGRGTPFGTVIPTIKVSTNSDLAKRKPHWIDFNAGALLESAPEEVDKLFREKVFVIVNGEKCANERNGDENIAIFKDGVTL